MSSHLSRNDLHRKYRHLGVQIVSNVGPTSGPKWSVELTNGPIGLARNLMEAELLIESFIEREQEVVNVQRQDSDHSDVAPAEQSRDSGTSQPDDQPDDPGPTGQ